MNRTAAVVGAAIAAALIMAAIASAAGPPVAWSTKDMKTAIRGLGYPKPHPKKLGCKGIGAADSTHRFTEYRCVATYPHHRHRRFLIGGVALGGWLCAGKTSCVLLKHGFVTNAQLASSDSGELSAAAEFASRGYLQLKYGVFVTYPKGSCTETGAATWACPYNWTDNATMTVTVTFRNVKTGYVTAADGAVS